MPKTEKLSIRLLREGVEPEDALRRGGLLSDWPEVPGAKLLLDQTPDRVPKWVTFLKLTQEQQQRLHNQSAIGVLFVPVSERWFVLSFGFGHARIDPSSIVIDFGLRVVVNSVDPKSLRSADLRTPDENTLSRRTQTSRASEQTAFAIDVERDIVRGLAGIPRDREFADRIAGSDQLVVTKKMSSDNLPEFLENLLERYNSDDYREGDFRWIDQIRTVRDGELIAELDQIAAKRVKEAVASGDSEGLHLAFPIIYDPGRITFVKYRRFGHTLRFPELEIENYITALQEKGVDNYDAAMMRHHSVVEVDDHGSEIGGKWSIYDCLHMETTQAGRQFVLSGGAWYEIDKDLARSVRDFFARVPRVVLPAAQAGETEQMYNGRISQEEKDYLCLDQRLIRPTGAASPIEVCDFYKRDRAFIHIKDETSSSRLSHLFAQGTVSARVLAADSGAREAIAGRMRDAEEAYKLDGFADEFVAKCGEFDTRDFRVVFAVISAKKKDELPFFSLMTLRSAVTDIRLLGFDVYFSFIRKNPAAGLKSPRKKRGK